MKPIRAAAVIKTDHGLLLGGDSYKDKNRKLALSELDEKRDNAIRHGKFSRASRLLLAKSLVETQGRLSLIGGTVEEKDYLDTGIQTPIDVETPHFRKDLERIMAVIRKAIVREVDEELSLAVDPDSVQFIRRIVSQNRVHILCTVYAQGKVELNRAEILGLGLMNEGLPSIPQNHYFYQRHAIVAREGFFNDKDEREKIKKMPVSKINVSQDIINDLYQHQYEGYSYAVGNKRFDERQPPAKLKSTRNFVIYKETHGSSPAQKPPLRNTRPTDPMPESGEFDREKSSEHFIPDIIESKNDSHPSTYPPKKASTGR